jgi:hypothetical protein
MTSNHINNYVALICKYTQFQNHRNKKAQDMELSDRHEDGFKLSALEYNTTNSKPDTELDHYVNTLERNNEDYYPGINDMLRNNLNEQHLDRL